MRVSPKVGDLVVMRYAWDKDDLYLDLKESQNGTPYSDPRRVLSPDYFALILAIQNEDAWIVTSLGAYGWVSLKFLETVSEYEREITS
jgi:hypothetical protein